MPNDLCADSGRCGGVANAVESVREEAADVTDGTAARISALADRPGLPGGVRGPAFGLTTTVRAVGTTGVSDDEEASEGGATAVDDDWAEESVVTLSACTADVTVRDVSAAVEAGIRTSCVSGSIDTTRADFSGDDCSDHVHHTIRPLNKR